ncbi:MAG: glycerol dehydrogenase [Candidatus Methanomethylophilaceae archaeon]|nr:glycerol dehydrogenase [Candidatus Methanomethylophilaceae archaeon]
MLKNRETAWRIFSNELNASVLEIQATEEKGPSYVVTPLGAKVNRVLIAGTLTEKENVGGEEEAMWKGRIQDVSGNYFISVGRYQQEASRAIASIEVPCFVAATGRVKLYTNPETGKTYITVRPEQIVKIDEGLRDAWLLETAKQTWTRLNNFKAASQDPGLKAEDLVKKGSSPAEAEGIIYALEHNDEVPDSMTYIKTLQAALRVLLPDREIDFGLPEDVASMPDEPEVTESMDIQDGHASKRSYGQLEDIILDMLSELDRDGKGAPRDELERRAEAEGISSIELEEISNILMDKGLVYEPNLRYLKRI